MLLSAILCGILFSGCVSSRSALPLTDQLQSPQKAEVYAGRSKAYQFSGSEWIRMPSNDYEFIVLRKMEQSGWETIKEIHRRHPEYDGRAGARDQTLYFNVRSSGDAGGRKELIVDSTWGKGSGHADADLLNLVVEFTPEISIFAPFNTFRITQRISYADGRLIETVDLFKKKDGAELLFMKMEEEAVIFLPMKN